MKLPFSAELFDWFCRIPAR